MQSSERGRTTEFLRKAFSEGDPDAQATVFEALGQELRRMAGRLMAQERTGHTWQPSDLVNECVLELLREAGADVRDKTRFLAIARRKMQHLLVDYARRRDSQKRGGGLHRNVLDDCLDEIASHRIGDHPVSIAEFNEALALLEKVSPEQFEVLTASLYCRLEVADLAVMLDRSESTVYAAFQNARAFVYMTLRGSRGAR